MGERSWSVELLPSFARSERVSCEGKASEPRKNPSYFPLNPGWLMTGSLFTVYEIIPI